ncbi:hypothetical protein F3087_40005 [Nocardia colli]|uniref:Uncharacterized protein n=1 Tax=Nocardia colli TaxID=2545717 RepID=A0A5N0E0M9_9NOCA|nr:hypothetical protein [Nocardia colli]KAA8881859.1 hypothetical protein F3087_40005 [Nocardia colli]
MERKARFVARLAGLIIIGSVAMAVAGGTASAAGVNLLIDTNGDAIADTSVAVGAGLGLLPTVTCAVVDPLLPASTSVVAHALGIADLDVEGVVIGCE